MSKTLQNEVDIKCKKMVLNNSKISGFSKVAVKGGNPFLFSLLQTTHSMENGGPPHGSGYQASGAQPTKVLWGAVDRRPKSLEIISIVMVYAFKYRIGNFVKLCTFVRGGGGVVAQSQYKKYKTL